MAELTERDFSEPLPDEPRPRAAIARAGLALALIAALLAAISGFGTRLGVWHYRTGFDLLRWATYLTLGGVAVSILGIVLARGRSRRGLALGLFGVLVGLGVAYVPFSWMRKARSVPPIHDITTDTREPPHFDAILPLRRDAENPSDYGGPDIAYEQREAYPDIQPLALDIPADEAFRRAHEAAEAMGWEIVDAQPSQGRIEATDTTFWFGFKDDVIIRVVPAGGGSRVDVRSVSRVGRSDVGTNADRIREYLSKIREIT